MFGYIRIYKPQLRICEYETYRAVYCTLCRHLGRQMGVPARLMLNYDYTFMALLMIALSGEKPCFEQGRCVVNPLKKCGSCTTNDRAFEYTSALTAIMFYYKLKDSIADSGGVRRLLWRTLQPYASHVRGKAKKLYPEEDALVSEYITRQFAAEKHAKETGDLVVDELCQPTADVLSAFAERLSDREERWEQARVFGNDSLNMSVAEAVKYYELLDLGEFKPIADNIIYLGVSEAQRSALFPPDKKRRRNSDKNQINTGVEEK